MSEVQITQVRSVIGALAAQRATLRTLGLRRIGDTVSRPDTPEVRGMIRCVSHLVAVRPATGLTSATPAEGGRT